MSFKASMQTEKNNSSRVSFPLLNLQFYSILSFFISPVLQIDNGVRHQFIVINHVLVHNLNLDRRKEKEKEEKEEEENRRLERVTKINKNDEMKMYDVGARHVDRIRV